MRLSSSCGLYWELKWIWLHGNYVVNVWLWHSTLLLNQALCKFQVVIDMTCFEFLDLFSLFLKYLPGDQTLNTSNNRLFITSCMIWFAFLFSFASHSYSFKGTALQTNWKFLFFVFAAFCIVYPSFTKWSQKHFKLSCSLFVFHRNWSKMSFGGEMFCKHFFFSFFFLFFFWQFQLFVYPNSCNNHYQPLCWHII